MNLKTTLIKGMSVTLINMRKVGENDFGEDITEETETIVDNVLVSPSTNEEIESGNRFYGKHAIYTIAIPKGDANVWEDSYVEFFGRRWKTFGMVEQGIEANVPGQWHKKIRVERFE